MIDSLSIPSTTARSLLRGLLVLAVIAAPARSQQALDDLHATLQPVLELASHAAIHLLTEKPADAVLSLAEAILAQQELNAFVVSPETIAALGKQAKKAQKNAAKLEKLLLKAGSQISLDGLSLKKPLGSARSAYKFGLKWSHKLKKPILVEKGGGAGFHKPGQKVTFKVCDADGSACMEPPEVEISNAFGAEAVVLNEPLNVNPEKGTFSVVMGPEAGGASVTVSACGQSSTKLLYNYGPKNGGGAGSGSGAPSPKYDGVYSATATTHMPCLGPPVTLSGIFVVTDGYVTDLEGGTFTGAVDGNGYFLGTTQICEGCIPFAMSGKFSLSGYFVLSGEGVSGSCGTLSQSIVAQKIV